jgi:hypothetical protein
MPRHARAPACFLRRLILSMSLLLHLPEPAHADTAAAAAAAAQLDRQGRRYYLAVGAVFRDEAPSLTPTVLVASESLSGE